MKKFLKIFIISFTSLIALLLVLVVVFLALIKYYGEFSLTDIKIRETRKGDLKITVSYGDISGYKAEALVNKDGYDENGYNAETGKYAVLIQFFDAFDPRSDELQSIGHDTLYTSDEMTVMFDYNQDCETDAIIITSDKPIRVSKSGYTKVHIWGSTTFTVSFTDD